MPGYAKTALAVMLYLFIGAGAALTGQALHSNAAGLIGGTIVAAAVCLICGHNGRPALVLYGLGGLMTTGLILSQR